MRDQKQKNNKILDETALPSYYDNDHTFAHADLKQLKKHMINLLHDYDVKQIRGVLTQLNKKVA
jgi:hypothetical protein